LVTLVTSLSNQSLVIWGGLFSFSLFFEKLSESEVTKVTK
jgi:hypothetical protein